MEGPGHDRRGEGDDGGGETSSSQNAGAAESFNRPSTGTREGNRNAGQAGSKKETGCCTCMATALEKPEDSETNIDDETKDSVLGELGEEVEDSVQVRCSKCGGLLGTNEGDKEEREHESIGEKVREGSTDKQEGAIAPIVPTAKRQFELIKGSGAEESPKNSDASSRPASMSVSLSADAESVVSGTVETAHEGEEKM